MKRRTWKRIISLVLCALLLISVVDLSGIGRSKAEELDELATVTDAGEVQNEEPNEKPNEKPDETPDFDFSVFMDGEGNFDAATFMTYLETLSDEEYQAFIAQYGDTIDFLSTSGFFGEEVDTPALMSNSGESVVDVHTTSLDFDGFSNVQVSWFNMSDGRAALCVTHAKSRPNIGQVVDNDSETGPSVWDRNMSEELYRCFYFGWLKEKGSEVFSGYSNSVEMGYLAVSLIATEEFYPYNPNDPESINLSLNTGAANLQGKMKEYANAHAAEIPNAESIVFTKTDLSSSAVGDKFETEYVTFGNNDGTTQSVSITLPANISAVVKRTNGTEVQCSPNTDICVSEGEQIKFQAPTSVTGDYTITATSSEEILSHQARCYYFGDNFQRLLAKKVSKPSVNLNFEFQPSDVYLKVTKESANVAATTGSNCYSLQGAVFGVYASQADAAADSAGSAATAAALPANPQRLATLTTDVNGNTMPVKLTAPSSGDQYYVKELIAPKGYFLNSTIFPVTVTTTANATSDSAANVTVMEQPKLDPLEILIRKTSDNNRKVAGAQYTVKFYKTPEGTTFTTDPALSGYSVDRCWVFETDNNGVIRFRPNWLVNGDEFYLDANGNPSLPYGTVTIQETSAPDGYELDDTLYVRMITPGINPGVQASNVAIDVTDEVQHRGDLKFRKVDESGHPIANVKFTITDELGEVHTIWTDANGYYSTESSHIAHSHNTNRGKLGDGVWFGAAAVDDTRGALPFGTYTIKEQRCPANSGKYKDLAAFTVTITPDEDVVIDAGNITNKAFPTISTMAWDNKTLTNVASMDETINVTDTCFLNNLDVGHTYTISGIIMDVESGTELLDNGNPVTATKTFTATAENMNVDVTGFSFSRDCVLDKKEIVFFQTLTDAAYPGEVIAADHDLQNKNETITFVKVQTTAKDSVTGTHEGLAGKTTTIIDTVKYEGLLPGKEYELEAALVYRDTGLPVENDGTPIVVKHKFTPAASDGAEDVKITFDAGLLDGKSVTVFENMYYNAVLIAAHAELVDEQTVSYPSVHTTAKDSVTMEHIGCVSADAAIIDTIDYKNLIPDVQYDVVAKLVYKEDGSPVIQDGREYEVKTSFVPAEKNGSYDVKLEHINAELLGGKTVTVLEYLYQNNKLVAKHEDLVEEQSIHYPAGGTTARDSVTGANDFLPSKEQKFIDTCTYENLIPGKEYSVEGVLMTKTADGKETPLLDANGKEISGKTVFTPATSDGTVDVTFTFDGSLLAGETVVCFETFYYENREIFAHKDINDKGQTLKSPAITTKARDSVNLTQYGEKSETAGITDTIVYTNTVAGEKYEVTGWLMDKKTNTPVLDAGGNPIRASRQFVAGENGEVSVQYSIDVTMFITKDADGNDVIDKDVVVFEELWHIYADGTRMLVAEEKDIHNADQTIHYQSTPKTGDHAALKFMICALIISGAGMLLMIRKKKVK